MEAVISDSSKESSFVWRSKMMDVMKTSVIRPAIIIRIYRLLIVITQKVKKVM
jgi:hypothetical protein